MLINYKKGQLSIMNVFPKISIIVPIYNIEDYVSKCIDSILQQTYENIEIICVDDGSTDKSGQIIDSYAKENEKIQRYRDGRDH